MAAAFIAPAALVILLVVVVPLARAAWMSVFNISLVRPGDEPFVGLGNYIEQLTSALYLEKREDVDHYMEVMNQLATDALTPAGTTRFLKEIIREI